MASEFNELASQVLSQDEIESLLEQFSGEDAGGGGTDTPADMESTGSLVDTPTAAPEVQTRHANLPKINFRVPSYLKHRQVRFLEVRHDQFARRLTDRLSLYLRKEVRIDLDEFGIRRYSEIKADASGQHYFAELHVEGFPINGFIQIPVEMGLLVIDRMLGGNGEKFQSKGGLTEIEIVLLDQLVGHVMDQWAMIWEDLIVCRHRIAGHESDIKHLHITSGQNPVIESQYNLRIGSYEGVFRMAFPAIFWEPILSRVNETILARTQAVPEVRGRNNEAMMKLKVNIHARWEGHEITARELSEIKPGDFIYFNKSLASKTTVMVADLPKFVGMVGDSDGKRAIRIEKIVESKNLR